MIDGEGDNVGAAAEVNDDHLLEVHFDNDDDESHEKVLLLE